MKRKLNEDDVPIAVSVSEAGNATSGFSTLGLDSRLLQAIAKENFSSPTLVQSKAIPLALEGKDILGMHRRDVITPSQTNFTTKLDPRPALAKLLLISFRSYNPYSKTRLFVNAGTYT